MTEIRSSTGAQRAKWREQSIRIAKELRSNPPKPKAEDGKIKIGVAFDDAMVTIRLDPEKITTMTQPQLAEEIYRMVIEASVKAPTLEQVAQAVAAHTADNGNLIELGWKAMLTMVMPKDASPQQIADMRMAYYGGAQHLYASIMGILDPGPDTEPTDRDMARMGRIAKELDDWAAEMKNSQFNQAAPKGPLQ